MEFSVCTWLLLLLMLSMIPSSISSPPSQLTSIRLYNCGTIASKRTRSTIYATIRLVVTPCMGQRLETSCKPKPLDPTLAWCIEFQHYFHPIGEICKGIIHELRTLVDDMSEDTQQRFDQLPEHVQMAYQREHAVTQIPVLLQLLKMIGYPQIDILRRELSSGFPLLGKLTPGVNWYIRTDDKYTSPSSIDELRRHNHEYVLKKLREARVDDHHEVMLDEIISAVNIGRINGPFEAPAEWRIKCVRPRRCPHLTLLPIPHEFPIIAVAFSIEQIGSDCKRKIRRGVDWRRSGHNRTYATHGQPFHHTTDHLAYFSILASNKHPHSQLDVWGHDHDGAYRQLPFNDPAVAYVLLITPEGPTLWNHKVLLFGFAASVRSETADSATS